MNNKLFVFSMVLVALLFTGCKTKTPTRIIVDERFNVLPLNSQDYSAALETGDSVDVSLTVLEGGNLDIDFYIIDAGGRKLVSRNRVGEMRIQWKVPSSGTYYFKYDNGMSLVTPKTVKTRVQVN